MGQALYRKYRSKKLSEIVGQKPITTALEHALASGQISHAYLFTGPRGVGKTSVARILAHEINGLTYETDELPIDIIEIDAASNRGIEDIRDLREKVRFAPVSAKYKVYIIDEVHMLTTPSFNALLKTLEEPPAHVIFILATTEAHKLPETIISRTQRYSFKLASQEDVMAHLKEIAKKESIAIDDKALALLAKHSGGSLRDALSLLDQVRHSATKVDVDTVQNNLGLPSAALVKTIMQAVQAGDSKAIIDALNQAQGDGASATLIAEQLLQGIRTQLASKDMMLSTEESLQLAQNLLLVESSSRPDVQLELALIGAQLAGHSNTHPVVSAAKMQTEQPPLTISEPAKRPPKKPVEPAVMATIAPQPATVVASIIAEPTPEPTQEVIADEPIIASGEMSADIWKQALDKIRLTHNTIYSILRMAQPNFDNIAKKQMTLYFKFPFHQKRINEAKNKQVILDTLALFGIAGHELACELIPKEQRADMPEVAASSAPEAPPIQDNPLLNQIRSVFGGAEVLE